MVNISRLLVFKPGGQAKLPIVETQEETLEAHALAAASPETIENGRALYNTYCSVCHGGNAVSGGLVPDLRYRIGALAPAWRAIVIEGALVEAGMPGWAPFMSPEEADEILAYVAHEATLGHQRGEKRVVRR